MKALKPVITLATITLASTLSLAAGAPDAPQPGPSRNVALAQAGTADTTDMTDGEVRKVDRDTKKITIKHGDIKNLDMPGMTMLFQVTDPALLDRVKPGDKVKFRAERAGSGIVVTEIRLDK